MELEDCQVQRIRIFVRIRSSMGDSPWPESIVEVGLFVHTS